MARLSISRATLDALVATKQLPVVDVSTHLARPDQARKGVRVNRALRFRDEDVEAFIASRLQAAEAKPPARPTPGRQPQRGRLLELPGATRYAGGHRA
jgi:predicted DNA-binding transcriptional regulator AlpA